MLKTIIKILFIFLFSIQHLVSQDNYLYFLNSPDEAVLSRIHIIEKAEKEILVSYFIFEDDPFGLIALDLLLLKKEQNPDIKIKVLLDASSNRVDKSLWYYLEQKGIEVKEFHPMPKLFVPFNKISIKNFYNSLKNINFRMHDKIILVDNKSIIIGGRNIKNSYYGLDDKNFHDRDLYFHSISLGNQIKEYFNLLWNSHHVFDITYNYYHKKGKHYTKNVNKLKNIRNYVLDKKKNYDKLVKNLTPINLGIKFKKVTFLNSYNKTTDKFNPEFLSTSLFNFAINTKKLMLIETPYLLPTKRFYKLIALLRQKGVKVQFVTNSFCSTDVMPVAAAYDNEKPTLDSLGVEIYEYKGPEYLHAKSAVFDDSIALVGSYNLDPRSAYINTELVFIIEDENITQKLKELIHEDMENCVKNIKNKDTKTAGYYDCKKSDADIFTYVIFKFLTRFSWLYNLF